MFMFFQTRPFWRCMGVSDEKFKNRFEEFFGQSEIEITERDNAIKLLLNVVSTIQERILYRLKNENSYDMLMKLYYIFDEVHSFYLKEKESRVKLSELNIDKPNVIDTFIENRDIMRNIIDACNIWIENAILYQHNVDTMAEAKDRGFSMDIDLLLDLYLYGFASQGVSLLTLSKNTGQELFYGLKITPKRNTPAEILKYHPIIFFNTAIAGNQNILVEKPLTPDANDTSFGKGFLKTYGVEFLLFLAVIKSFQDDVLRGDDKSLTVISREYFIYLVENYTNPKVDGNAFYESFVLTKEKVKQQLRKNEDVIWVMGTNKERHELRPFIGLEDGNVLISYGATEQAKQLWVSCQLFLYHTIMIMSVYGRFFRLYLYTAIAPVPLSTFAGEPSQSVGKSFIKSYAAVCLEGAIIVLACIIFSLFAASPPAVDPNAAPVSMVWSYIGELVFNMLVLVGAVKMADRVVREMMGL